MPPTSYLRRSLSDDSPLPAEIRALMGVYVLYWRLVETIDTIELDPPLAKSERKVVIKLDRPTRMGDLARDMHATASSITALADGLEQKGLLKRERDPQDRRAWQLMLTPKGSALRETMISKASLAFRNIAQLSETDVETFADLASRIADTILETGLPEGLKE